MTTDTKPDKLGDMTNAKEQAMLDICNIYYCDGDTYLITNAPKEVVREVFDIDYESRYADNGDLDDGSEFHISELNKRGYVAAWSDIIIDW